MPNSLPNGQERAKPFISRVSGSLSPALTIDRVIETLRVVSSGITRAAMVTACLGLALGIAGRPALAEDHPFFHGPPPLRGVVLQASSRSLQIQTANDAVSFLLSKHTQVFRVASGSLADLRVREIVTVKVTPGTTDVQQVVISSQMASAHSHHDRHAGHRHRSQKPPLMQPTDPGVYRDVQIMNLGNNKMQVRNDRGDTVSFAIDDGTKVIKILKGSVHDLAMGESVLVLQNPQGYALSVKILSS